MRTKILNKQKTDKFLLHRSQFIFEIVVVKPFQVVTFKKKNNLINKFKNNFKFLAFRRE